MHRICLWVGGLGFIARRSRGLRGFMDPQREGGREGWFFRCNANLVTE